MRSDEFSIVSDNENKNFNKKQIILITSIVSIFVLICVIILAIYMRPVKTVDASSNSTKSEENYNNIKKIYSSAGIDYTEDDYKKDLALESNSSDDNKNANIKISKSAQKIADKNNSTLKQIGGMTGLDYDQEKLKKEMIDQLNKTRKFILDHAGYPDDQYDNVKYGTVKKYNDQLIKSISGGEDPKNAYNNIYTIDQQKNKMRYSIANLIPYSVVKMKTEYKDTLKDYLLLGYPEINSIDAITVETPLSNKDFKQKSFDNSLSDLTAVIVVGDSTYKVYLCTNIKDDGGSMYKILDIEKE